MPAPKLFDARGNPVSSSNRASDSAWETLRKLGVERDDDGNVRISQEALRQIRAERMRRMAVTSIPSTPRYLQRDAGGVGVGKRGTPGGRLITNEGLRAIRERSPLIQVIHAARHYQVRHLCRKYTGEVGSVGWKVVHKHFHQKGKDPPKEILPYIQRFEAMLEAPAPSYDVNSAGTLIGALIEDLMTINRPAVEVLHSLLDRKRVVQIRHIDGATVWPTLIWLEKWKADHPHWAGSRNPRELTQADELEIASAAMQWDMTGARYCLVRDGILEGVANPDRLIVAPIINRTGIEFTGYWPSHVEQSLELIGAFVRTFDYNANYFTRGMLAEFAIMISGDVHNDDAAAFIDQLREGSQGVDNAWQPPLIQTTSDGDVKTLPLKESNREMMFEVWMALNAALQLAIYRMHPSTANVKPWEGGSGGSLNAPKEDKAIDLAREEGLQGDIQHITDEILNPLARRCHPDLVVMWHYGDDDPTTRAEIYDKRTNIDMSRNDVRVREGDHPRGFWVPDEQLDSLDDEQKKAYEDNIWNWPKDSAFASAKGAADQLEMQKDQMAQQADQQQQQMGADAQQQPTGWEDDADGHGGPGDEDDGFGQPGTRRPFGAPPGGKPGQPPPQQGSPPGNVAGQPPPKPKAPPKAPMRKGTRRPITVVVYDAK